MLYGLCKRR